MTRLVYETRCPGCSKRIHAPSEDKRRASMVRHMRNCNVLRPQIAAAQVAAEAEGVAE